MPSPWNAATFRSALHGVLSDALDEGRQEIVVNSGLLHRKVGGYPGAGHRMPICCEVMRQEFDDGVGDAILEQPPRGKGASLTIRYTLPRPPRG